jgi:hypothetical protein
VGAWEHFECCESVTMDDNGCEENPLMNPNGHPDKLAIPSMNEYLPCEFQKNWRTTCQSQMSTNPDNQIVYNSYSCALFFCKYPGKSCEVKR